jgi:ABC-type branched-subunit amino acid transport system ATPase component
MERPKRPLLDEPDLVLAPLMVEQFFEKIVEVNGSGQAFPG